MRHQVVRLSSVVLATTLVALVGVGTLGFASGKRKGKPLKVTCEQLYAEIEKTGAQLTAQYNAMGFTIDGFTIKNACQKQGKRIRYGGGFMNDINNEGDPPFPGETNPAVREYFWTWSETVTRTKKGKLRAAITELRCEKYIYTGSPSNPQDLQTLPC